MFDRLDYMSVNGPAINSMLACKNHLNSIDAKLQALIELRVSQINGCAFCVDLHATEARAAGESAQRLDCLAVWKECPFFEEHERAALAWAEAVTRISGNGTPQALYDALAVHFSDRQVVDLTLIIAQMNAWNRVAVSMGHKPDPRH